MKIVARLAFAVVALSCMGACSGESSIDAEAEERPLSGREPPAIDATGVTASEIDGAPANTALEETLAELNVGGETLSFLRWGEGSDAVYVLRGSAASARGSLADAVEQQAGQPLTFLELFRALAASDEAVPSALVESHAEQARALGRSGDEEIRVALQVDKIAPPPGVHPCAEDLTFSPGFVWIWRHHSGVSEEGYLCTGEAHQGGGGVPSASSCTQYTKLRQRVRICQNVSSAPGATAYAGYGVLGGSWSFTPAVSVPNGEYMWWEFAGSATSRRLAVVAVEDSDGFSLDTGVALQIQ
jgi:hypothetical protein